MILFYFFFISRLKELKMFSRILKWCFEMIGTLSLFNLLGAQRYKCFQNCQTSTKLASVNSTDPKQKKNTKSANLLHRF